MYEKFYGFTEKPFNSTPDSKFFFPSDKHTEALNSMYYAIQERKGFVVITGEIGAGKTTITRALIHKLSVNTKIALVTNTHITTRELIEEVLEEFEVTYRPGTKRKLLAQLNEYLIEQLAGDINVVLIIDEAQNLSSKVLEEVRMLSNLETEKEKLIQIILVGQPQLKKKLERSELAQFKQRIAVYYHLDSLNRQETEEYIRHRLRIVSTQANRDIFTPGAIDAVYEYSQGVPRIVNLLCDSALLSGYVDEKEAISASVIHEVYKESQFECDEEFEDKPEFIAPQPRMPLTQSLPKITETPASEPEVYEPEPPKPKVSGPGGFVILRNPDIFKARKKTVCCPGCPHYMSCLTKWERGTRGEEQACCRECPHHQECQEKIEEES